MATPKTTTWPCDPHTRAKHLILREYLNAWVPIISRTHRRAIYVDGFSGPGEYVGGEKGSPIVVLDAVLNHQQADRSTIDFVFIEAKSKRYNHLKSLLADPRFADLHVTTHNAKFDNAIPDLLTVVEKSSARIPLLVFVDPFGFSGVPFTVLARILALPSAEVFVLFARDSVNRWLKEEGVSGHLRELFGLESISLPQGEDRLEFLFQLYDSRLRTIANYVAPFSMYNDKGRIIYDLFFASNNCKGLEKMKEAMWKVDSRGDFRFRDADDPTQTGLFLPDIESRLRLKISDHFEQREGVDAAEILSFVVCKTEFLAKHARDVLNKLETEGCIVVDGLKRDGSRRRNGTFPKGANVHFRGCL